MLSRFSKRSKRVFDFHKWQKSFFVFLKEIKFFLRFSKVTQQNHPPSLNTSSLLGDSGNSFIVAMNPVCAMPQSDTDKINSL